MLMVSLSFNTVYYIFKLLKNHLGKIMYCRGITGESGKEKKSLCQPSHKASTEPNSSWKCQDAWQLSDRPALCSLPLPSQRSPFDSMCLFLRDSTTHVYSGCKRELSSGKRGQTEHKGPHRTAGNLLGGGNFLSGVRERFLTFSFLSSAREISELCPPHARHQTLAARPATCPGAHSQKAQCCHLGPALPPGRGGAARALLHT